MGELLYALLFIFIYLLLVNPILGAITLCALDDENESLLKWYEKCHLTGWENVLVLTCWPIWIIKIKKQKNIINE